MMILIIFLVAFAAIISAQYPQRSGKRKYSDESGKYAKDDSGKYLHDNSGAYEPDYSGQYVPDDSGKYLPDDSGKYLPDNSGKYYPDYTGSYVTDKSGRYNFDEVLRQNKAKQIRKTRSISPRGSAPSNMYLPALDYRRTETPTFVSADATEDTEANTVAISDVNNVEITENGNELNASKLFTNISPPLPIQHQFTSSGTKYLGGKFKHLKYDEQTRTLPRYPKLEELLKPTIRKLMGVGFSLIYNKINKSHVVVNYGPNQNISQRLIPMPVTKRV